MKRTKIGAAALAGLLAALLLACSASAGTSGTSTVTARVRAFAAVTQTDASHVRVQANTPWTLEIATTHGETLRIEGAKTSGYEVALPDDTQSYSLAWD
ncbi:MAG: hypothetical protein N3B11_01860 [Coriobacteriia bacterium]|nr:hypothetical protein [Coriobacteriia bacterium]